MGLNLVSIGHRVRIWTSRQAIDVNEANLVNAKASTNGTVKVTASKGFRFSGAKVAAKTVAFA